MTENIRSLFRSTSHPLALEARLLFDGAGAVAVADHFDTGGDQHADPQPHDTPPATDADRGEAMEHPASAAILVIIDARVADHESLVEELPAGMTVRVVGADESGIDVIGNELARRPFDAVHILSHGTPGALTLGSDTLSGDTLAGQGTALQGWAQHLGPDADILLYGCDIAQGEAGQLFITGLAHLTGADIAASSNATGSSDRGGDWVLEETTGPIAATVFGFANYDGLLAAPTVLDNTPPERPITVGENTGGEVGEHIAVSGTGADTLTVTASVGKGTLSATTFTGNAAAVQAWLAGLDYAYTGGSETGDTDTLTLSIVNDTSGGAAVFTRGFTVTPENDAPVLTPPASGGGRLTVAEGGNVGFSAAAGNGTAGNPVTQANLGLVDPDNSQAQIIVKLTALPGQGVLTLNGNELSLGSTFAVSDIASVRYRHNGNQVLSTATDTFRITVDDGAGGLLTDQTVTVDITPKNDAPTASGSITLIEGETGVALVGGTIPVIGGARGNLAIGDPDDTSHDVLITALPTHGTLKYDGVVVTPNQSIPNAALFLFTYDHDGSETGSDSFRIKVSDAGGGTGTPIQTGEQTIALNIIPNNDDPWWDASTLPNGAGEFPPVVFGPDSGTGNLGTTLPITSSLLLARDVESPPERITYTLTGIPAGGHLVHTGLPGQYLPTGFTFTQKDIDDGLIQYVSTTGSNHSDAFTFTVMDGDRRLFPSPRDGGIYADDGATTPLTEHTFRIEYQGTATGSGPGTALTPAPVPVVSGSRALGITDIAEGQFYTLGTSQLSAVSAGVAPDQLTYRLLGLPTNGAITLNDAALPLLGSFTQQDIVDGKVKFVHDGSEDFNTSFTFDVSNGSVKSAADIFSIEVKPQNDTPTAGQGDTVKLTEGATVVLNAGGRNHITLADSDNDASDRSDGYAADNTLSLRLTALPTQGTLEHFDGSVWAPVSLNQIIAQADLDAGRLRYTHDGSENYSDSFTIVPLDDSGVATTSGNTDANSHPPGGDPTNQKGEGAPAVIGIQVNPLNDAPTYVGQAEPGHGASPALREGGEFTIWGAASYTGGSYGTGSGTAAAPADKDHYLIYQDSDNSSEQRQFRITTAPRYGTLTADGRTLSVGSVFTQAELDSGVVKYRHSGGEQSGDSFFYVVSDGDYSSNAGTTDNASAFA